MHSSKESYPIHQAASIFPMMDQAAYVHLRDDIRANGLREPVILLLGKVIDGRNRATACTMAGAKLKTREFSGTYAEALAFVWSENFHRRHLNSGQGAVAHAKRMKMESDYAETIAKMKARQPKGGRPKKDDKPAQLVGPDTERHDRSTSSVIAEEKPELPEGVSRGQGVTRANEALNCLMRIPKNDGLRSRAFQIVTDWIQHNGGEATPARRKWSVLEATSSIDSVLQKWWRSCKSDSDRAELKSLLLSMADRYGKPGRLAKIAQAAVAGEVAE